MTEINPNSRLETFCDGVFAIALTLLVLNIRVPSPTEIHTTADLWLATTLFWIFWLIHGINIRHEEIS